MALDLPSGDSQTNRQLTGNKKLNAALWESHGVADRIGYNQGSTLREEAGFGLL